MRLPSPKNSPSTSTMEPKLHLHDYIYKNDVKNIKASITENNVNVTDTKGRTALFLAASLNRYELIDVLLTSGCDVSVADDFGNSPLHEAAEKGNTDVVKLLVAYSDCNLDVRNYDGETPLMKAAYYDYGEIARILLKNGADPNAVDNSGQTALLIALRESSHVTVEHLLKHGCDVSVTDKLGHSALYIAIHSSCNKSLDLAKTLLGSGYDISQDKEWLLNEEKHNLFYQDDEFYNRLRRILTHNDITSRDMMSRARSHSTNDATSVSSPALRQRKLATVTDLLSVRSPQIPSANRTIPCSSPVSIKKSSNLTNGSSPQFSSLPRYFDTPPSSPKLPNRKISGSSGWTQSQNEAPMSPATRTRRMTPCPPPTENMLGSPKLAPKLRICASLPSSPAAPSSPVDIWRKKSQTSPLAKGSGSSSPFSSPESSNPSSPVTPRKALQSPLWKSPMTSPLVIGKETGGSDKVAKCLQEKETSGTDEATSSGCPPVKMPASPALKRIIKQGSLDSATPPGSPNLAYRRQIMVKCDVKDGSDKSGLKSVQRQLSVPSKSSVQFNANIQIIDVPRTSQH